LDKRTVSIVTNPFSALAGSLKGFTQAYKPYFTILQFIGYLYNFRSLALIAPTMQQTSWINQGTHRNTHPMTEITNAT
jgi:hypothetical protein